MTTVPNSLSPKALAQVPEVRKARERIEDIVRRNHQYGFPPDSRLQDDVDGDAGEATDAFDAALLAVRDAVLSAQRTPEGGRLDFGHERAQVLGLSSCPDDGKGNECELCAEQVDRLILAVRNEAVSAERARLLGLTSEQVVEAAAKAMRDVILAGDPTKWEDLGREVRADYWGAAVRAALPVLLAPERARREQAERERLRTALGADTGFDCVICTTRIYGAFIGAGDGSGQKSAHPACYYRRKVEKVDAIIDRVLAGDYGTEAQAIARALAGGGE